MEAITQESNKYPLRLEDTFPYADEQGDFWSGTFASRPTEKKRIAELSALARASNRMFAEKVIKWGTTDKQIAEILQTKDKIEDTMGILVNHDSISGTSS